jgi:hypothetical protein
VLILAVAIEVFYKYVSAGIDSDRMRGLNARLHRQNSQAKGEEFIESREFESPGIFSFVV